MFAFDQRPFRPLDRHPSRPTSGSAGTAHRRSQAASTEIKKIRLESPIEDYSKHMNGQITKKSMKFQWFLCRIDLTTNFNEEKKPKLMM